MIEGLQLKGGSFRQSLFIGSILKGCEFRSVRFDRCDFSGTKLVDCIFDKCSFAPDDFRSCVITNCIFRGCDFRGAQWTGITAEQTKFLTCDFREGSIHENAFNSCELTSCLLTRSSITINCFANCSFHRVNFGDCTALFLFFDTCNFSRCGMNAETVGFTYGLSAEDLGKLQLIHLGRRQAKPSSATSVDDFIATYISRKWSVGVCVLQLNFRRAMPLLALRDLVAVLALSIDREIPFDWDEIRFLVQILERLNREQRLSNRADAYFDRVVSFGHLKISCSLGGNNGNTQRRVFLRSSPCGSLRESGSNGILPLPIMQILVRRTGKCLHFMEARCRAGHCWCGTCRHVSKDGSQSAPILQKMRRSSHDQSSATRVGGRICGNAADTEVYCRCPCQLCGNSFANAGRTYQAEGFSQRVRRLR